MDWRRKVSKFSKITIALAIAFATAFSLVPTSAQAFGGGMIGGANAARGSDQPSDLFGQAGIFSTITNVMLFIVGGVSVLMIIIGGLRYVLSGGDSGNVSAAKNTILYAIVGIIVSLLAYAVVSFVVSSFANNSGGGFASGFNSGTSATNF